MQTCASCLVLAAYLLLWPVILVADDVVFVQTDTAGVYEGKHGSLVSLTPTHVILKTDSGERLFARDAVHRIILTGEIANSSRQHWREILDTYWNSDRSPLVRAVQSFPIVGQPLRALDYIPTSIASTLASIALCLAFVWAGYKAYELTIVGRETSRLGRMRLQLEIAKLRNEALDLSQRLKFDEIAATLAAIDLPLPILKTTEGPEATGARPRIRHGPLLRIFMSQADRLDQLEMYRAEAIAAGRRGLVHARWTRIKHVFWLGLAEIFCGLYGSVALIGSAGSLLPASGGSGPESLSAAVALALAGAGLLRQAVRIGLRLRDVRSAYKMQRFSTARYDDIVGTA